MRKLHSCNKRMMAVLATDFTGPLYVVIGVGAVIALVGLAMVVAIWMGWEPAARRRQRAPADAGPWQTVE
jgi:hypothetical protein